MLFTKYLFAYLVCLLAHVRTSISSEQSDKHDKLTAQWNVVRSLNTGYVNEDFEMSTSSADMSNGQLRQAVIWKFEQLKCGYLFSAHFHFTMVGKLLKVKNLHSTDAFLKTSALFGLETKTMLKSLFYDKNYLQMDEVWSVHRYAKKIDFLINTFGNFLEIMISKRTNLLQMHDFFVTELESYLEDNCDDDNVLNIKSNICMHYKENESRLKKEISYEFAMTTVAKYNKILFQLIDNENNKKGLGLIASKDINTANLYNVIYNEFKKYHEEFETFCRLFLGPSDCLKLAPTVKIYRENIISADFGLKTILYLGKYNFMLKDIFKVCTLRIVFLSLSELNDVRLTSKTTFNSNVQILSKNLTKILNSLDLNHNDLLYEIDSFLKLDSIHNKNNIKRMMKVIKYNHKSISTTLGLPIRNFVPGFYSSEAKKLFIKDGMIIPERYSKTQELHIITIEFIKELNGRFKGSLSRELFNSYMQFIENKERRMDKVLLNKKSDKHVVHLKFV